ncbi:glycerophosphodiester phosphodiesterase family protein [Herbiconiux sp. CPCC 205763]|uniref:glycerophosphodiester phosphodiesterase n=1 Tax=Herbiconiux aconitum TaxID=2970913 RepID=A0ABT2GPW9_9MICO|nr:glycerophosphodiester phosphodiesterase family protein [Herbiconiux aconitum]MCS5718258.1 glycerophosphodiester phosphodiesterase family protein [Herbiconiux aconitum]
MEFPGAHPLVIGHRGASGYRPEHTDSAYELAFGLGADAVEPDVVVSRDGVPVVRHENEISGTTDVAAHPEFADRRATKEIDGHPQTGWFTEDFTWAELQTLRAKERLPAVRPSSASFDGRFGLLRLSDVLRIVDEAESDVPDDPADTEAPVVATAAPSAVVELKHATYFESIGLPLGEIVAAELAEAGWSDRPGRLVLESFEKTVLAELRRRGVAAHYTYLIEDGGAPFDLVAREGSAAPDYASQLTDTGLAALTGEVDGISVDKSIIMPRDLAGAAHRSSDIVARAHAAGLQIFTWTLRAENRFLPRNFRLGHDKAAFGQWEQEFRAILATGVDGVFADQPDLAVSARRAVGGAA